MGEGFGQAHRGRGRGGLHQRGQVLRIRVQARPVADDADAQDQEDAARRERALLRSNFDKNGL